MIITKQPPILPIFRWASCHGKFPGERQTHNTNPIHPGSIRRFASFAGLGPLGKPPPGAVHALGGIAGWDQRFERRKMGKIGVVLPILPVSAPRGALDNDDHKAVLVKVSNMSLLNALSLIKQRLTKQQYEVFKETCFGHFVYLQDLQFTSQIVHALLLQYVRSTDKAMYFKIEQKECRFSILEFALITGLKCHKEHNHPVNEKDNDDNICDVFMGSNNEFTQKQLQKAFSTAQSNDDTLMVKFAMLYFLESALLGKEPKNRIDDFHIRLLDNFKEFNNYPWGRLSFKATMLSLKNTVWTYEVIFEFGQKFATEKGDLNVPRILKWLCKNKIMADFTVATTLNATRSDGSNEIVQYYMQWFLALEIEWKQEFGELNVQVDVVMDDRHATITDDISHTLFYAPSPGFFPSPRNAHTFQRTTPFHEKISKNVTPPCCVFISDHVAPTFQKIYDRLSKIEEKAKIVLLISLVTSPSCSMQRCVIMDTIYQRKLEQLYSVYVINPEKVWTNNATNYVVDYAKGEKLKCAVHWKDVSKVYILLHPKQHHWALAEFNLQKEIIFVYDSMLDYMNDSAFEKELLSFLVMMPLILDRISWYTSYSDDNSLTSKWKAVRVSDILQQKKNNNDCGVFVVFYLEALVNGLDIPYDVPTQAGINSYRKQVATRLFFDKKLIDECD
ncbi:hypothetical protein CUMW_253070 [Citrus unshiu]|uniref:Ubiquitin-like protease family profile domain-containing protein n=1 Tax=Citrus unshiu TaxID=55188 RepID=A0A2H5QQX5_CITUN|nr:hypothetical protein CUMW_253070 [Citrus unshiu]